MRLPDLRTMALVAALALLGGATAARADELLVPMDSVQTNHLKAYGLVMATLARGRHVEWLLDYRGGAFLMPFDSTAATDASRRGVTFEWESAPAIARMRAALDETDRVAVRLTHAPRVAWFARPTANAAGDPTAQALDYAGIPYTRVWDDEALSGKLQSYDVLMLGHQDFTGQHAKFYSVYRDAAWYRAEERDDRAAAARANFAKVTQLDGAVAAAIKAFVEGGGHLFAMCSATDSYDIALAARGVDIVDTPFDGDPPDPRAAQKLDFTRTLAFTSFTIESDPKRFRLADIDVTPEAARRGRNERFTLADIDARDDRVAAMLVQDHVRAIHVFLGMTTGYHRARIKDGVRILASVEAPDSSAATPARSPLRGDDVRYLCGAAGKGRFAFLGGHDPENYQSRISDPPTDLARHASSPGYRLILNNVLAAARDRTRE